MRINWHPPDLSAIPTAEHKYPKDYAVEVHDGDGDRKPARPWMETAIWEFDFAQAIADEIRGADFTRASLVFAWMRANEELGYAMDDAMNDERWSWPRLTYRQNGDVAGSPRDIVDTGELRDSRELNWI